MLKISEEISFFSNKSNMLSFMNITFYVLRFIHERFLSEISAYACTKIRNSGLNEYIFYRAFY